VRRPSADMACDMVVASNKAGYCTCPTGHYFYDAGHPPISCRDACAGYRPYQLDETRDVLGDFRKGAKSEKVSIQNRTRAWSAFGVFVLVVSLFLFLRPSASEKTPREVYEERFAKLMGPTQRG